MAAGSNRLLGPRTYLHMDPHSRQQVITTHFGAVMRVVAR
jgi:hypothetical protein